MAQFSHTEYEKRNKLNLVTSNEILNSHACQNHITQNIEQARVSGIHIKSVFSKNFLKFTHPIRSKFLAMLWNILPKEKPRGVTSSYLHLWWHAVNLNGFKLKCFHTLRQTIYWGTLQRKTHWVPETATISITLSLHK